MNAGPLEKPKKGEESVESKQLEARFVVTCAYHRGEAPVDHELRTDPETGKPRTQAVTLSDGTVEEQEVLFPIYSEKRGFQPDCQSCDDALFNASRHAAQVLESNLQADREFHAELVRRGMA